MKRIALAALAALAFTAPARAFDKSSTLELSCKGAFDLMKDAPAGDDDLVYVKSDGGDWTVTHLVAGMSYDRGRQYAAQPVSHYEWSEALKHNNQLVAEWKGLNRRKPWLIMRGAIYFDKKTGVSYGEWIFDTRLNATTTSYIFPCKVMSAGGKDIVDNGLTPDTKLPTAPFYTAPSPPPIGAEGGYAPDVKPVGPAPETPGMSVPLYTNGQRAQIDLILGGKMPVRMTVDTGASIMVVSVDVADRLVKTGLAIEGPGGVSTMADGSKIRNRTLVIRSVTIGDRTVENVRAAVTPGTDEMLLDLPTLNRIGRFSFDTPRKQLVFQ
jgi:hypothetical protein